MKATDLLKLVENSKTKAVPGELGKQKYQNDNSPSNHLKGKKMKQFTAPGGGEKHDKKPRADVGSPKKRERRSMEGPATKARKMNEAMDAKQIASLLVGSGRDPATGVNVIVVRDVNRNNKPIKIPMSDPKIYTRLLQAIKSGNDNLANQAYQQLINHQGAEMGGSSFRGKDEGGMQRGAGKGGANIGAPMSDAQIDAAASKFSLANSKGSKEKRIRENDANQTPEGFADIARAAMKSNDWKKAELYWNKAAARSMGRMRRARYEELAREAAARANVSESGGQRNDSMGKEKAATGGPISKSATVKSPGFDKKPSADVGAVKKKEKRSMGENPVKVTDHKGGDNEHKSMKKMHEAISELSEWLGTDLNLLENKDLPTFYLDIDNPPTCPECGARTEFDDAPGTEEEPQLHKCLNGKCGFQFKGEFDPEDEDFDESEGDAIMKPDFMDRKKKMGMMKGRGMKGKGMKGGSSSSRVLPARRGYPK